MSQVWVGCKYNECHNLQRNVSIEDTLGTINININFALVSTVERLSSS